MNPEEFVFKQIIVDSKDYQFVEQVSNYFYTRIIEAHQFSYKTFIESKNGKQMFRALDRSEINEKELSSFRELVVKDSVSIKEEVKFWLDNKVGNSSKRPEYYLNLLYGTIRLPKMYSFYVDKESIDNGMRYDSYLISDKIIPLRYGTFEIYDLIDRLLSLIRKKAYLVSVDLKESIYELNTNPSEQPDTDSKSVDKLTSSNLKWSGAKIELLELIQALQLSEKITENNKPINQKRILEIFSQLFPDIKLDAHSFNNNLTRGYNTSKRARDNKFWLDQLETIYLKGLKELIRKDIKNRS